MIKQWILDTFFKVQIEDVKRQGSIDAFTKAHRDIMDSMTDDTEKRANELAQQKLSTLLSPVDLQKIVTVDKRQGIVFVGSERLDEGRLASLKAEAEYFIESDLWALLYETPKELAQKAMFVDGDSIDTMKKGRSILYTLSAQRNIIDIFRSFVASKKKDMV